MSNGIFIDEEFLVSWILHKKEIVIKFQHFIDYLIDGRTMEKKIS